MYRIQLQVPQPPTSRLLMKSSILINCIVIFWTILCIFWILDHSRIVMPRLKYHTYFVHTSKYDCGLSINGREQYNNDINNPSNQAKPNSLIYNLSMDEDDGKRLVNKYQVTMMNINNGKIMTKHYLCKICFEMLNQV